jgi:hypothetical protein
MFPAGYGLNFFHDTIGVVIGTLMVMMKKA